MSKDKILQASRLGGWFSVVEVGDWTVAKAVGASTPCARAGSWQVLVVVCRPSLACWWGVGQPEGWDGWWDGGMVGDGGRMRPGPRWVRGGFVGQLARR